MPDERLGELEEIVLLAATVLGREASAVSMQAILRARASRKIGLGSLYGALDRLERKGYLRSEVRDSANPGERRKRFFDFTRDGLAALTRARAMRQQLWADIPASVRTGGRE